jgi:glutaredoxin
MAENNMDGLSRRILGRFAELQLSVLDKRAFVESAAEDCHNPQALSDAIRSLCNRGLLIERTTGFYSLTQAGRLSIARPRELTLLSRPGCHLCEEAESTLAPILREFKLSLRVVNIDQDATLRKQFTDDVPVLFLGTVELARHKINTAQLRAQIQRLLTPE